MIEVNDIAKAINYNKALVTDERLFVEIDGEILELCNITFQDGKVVLRPEVKINH